MTARPDAPELSAAERQFLDRPDEPEALRERVAVAMWDAQIPTNLPGVWLYADPWQQRLFRRMADAALAVVRGES